jgi:hypothetical protein
MLQEKEYIWLRRLEIAADQQRENLTRWEQDFLDDFLARFRVQLTTMHVSPGQWRVITEIGDKIIQ